MFVTPSSHSFNVAGSVDIIETYFRNFEILSKFERWPEIIPHALKALQEAKRLEKKQDEAKICAQLTLAAFNCHDYHKTIGFARQSRELSIEFKDRSLLVKTLYLESMAYRMLAPNQTSERNKQIIYQRAAFLADASVFVYLKEKMDDSSLEGKIYFNFAAVNVENPKGNLGKALDCYCIALNCFKRANAIDDQLRTKIQIGRIFLAQKNFKLCRLTLEMIKPLITNDEFAQQVEELTAHLLIAQKF